MDSASEITGEELRRICGRYQKKYGMAMDSMTATLLNEIQEKEQAGVLQQKEALGKVEDELKRMRHSIQPFATADPRVAFAYGLGKNAWLWIGMLVAGLGIILQHVRETTRADYLRAAAIIERYPHLSQLEPLIQSACILEKKQGRFLLIAPARSELLLGKTYLLNPGTRPPGEAPDILIPLQFN
ncbi:hypothetical protein [Telluribacter humicola]|uniref:hypothetical protein n=1 Tax=Telluribacter humicola TaxID=1720261 RepID=UPI001A95B60D|nr:hypothetical protein [Telluribacter humicola]